MGSVLLFMHFNMEITFLKGRKYHH